MFEWLPFHVVFSNKCNGKPCSSDRPPPVDFTNTCNGEPCPSDRPFTLFLAVSATENTVRVTAPSRCFSNKCNAKHCLSHRPCRLFLAISAMENTVRVTAPSRCFSSKCNGKHCSSDRPLTLFFAISATENTVRVTAPSRCFSIKCNGKHFSNDHPFTLFFAISATENTVRVTAPSLCFSNKCRGEHCSGDRPFTLLLAISSIENKFPIVSSLSRLNKAVVYIINRISVYIFFFCLFPILVTFYSCFTLGFCYKYLTWMLFKIFCYILPLFLLSPVIYFSFHSLYCLFLLAPFLPQYLLAYTPSTVVLKHRSKRTFRTLCTRNVIRNSAPIK